MATPTATPTFGTFNDMYGSKGAFQADRWRCVDNRGAGIIEVWIREVWG
jgi:hypothetical protein